MATLRGAAKEAGVVLQWIVAIVWFGAGMAVNIWVLLRYGFFFWLVIFPILLSVVCFLFGMVFAVVGAVISGIYLGLRWLFCKATGRQ